MKNHSRCSQVTAVVRILTGALLLVLGISKLGADPALQATIGSAGHSLGLTFLTVTTRFRIAVAIEILAGVSLLFGYKVKWGSILTILFVLIAWNHTGWNLNYMAMGVLFGSIFVLIKGTGAWAIEPSGGCSSKGCCGGKGGSCCGGVCGHDHEEDKEIVEV